MSKQQQQQQQWAEVTERNAKDIVDIKHSIDTIKNNHLHHIEADMAKQSKLLDRLDMRLWAILMLLVVGIVVPALVKGLL